MTSIVKFRALSGAHGEGPLCYLLKIDEFNFLLDCGWTESFNVAELNNLKSVAPKIDAVLLSHPDILHLGALPYAYGHLGLRCPIYCTTPVHQMGQFFMYEAFQAKDHQEDFTTFTLDDIDGVLAMFNDLKYSQTVSLSDLGPKGKGITITAYAAGHMIGGAVWKIMKDAEEILYAVDYNHRRERHLDGTVLESLTRPNLLITDALNTNYKPAKRKDRDNALAESIISALRKGGDVLIMSDTAGRVLELLQLLEQLWETQKGLTLYPLVLLARNGSNVLEFAQHLVEFMADRLLRTTFEEHHDNPFQLRNLIKRFSMEGIDELEKNSTGPKLVLTGLSELSCGFGLELFTRWASKSQNLIVFTEKPVPGSLGRKLIDNPSLSSVTIDYHYKVPLEGEELAEYERMEAERKAEEEAERIWDEAQEKETADDSDEEGADADALLRHDLMDDVDNSHLKGAQTRFFKQMKTFPMFPNVEEKIVADEYGEIINPDDYKVTDDSQANPGKQKPEQEEDVEMAEEEFKRIPQKAMTTSKTIDIVCQIKHIDLEGRTDGPSMKNILTNVKPRQMIVIHGTTEASESLVDFCAESDEIPLENICCPKVNELVDVTSDSNIYQMRLKDELVSSLRMSEIDGHELAWVDGVIEFQADAMIVDEAEDQEIDTIPSLGRLPQQETLGHTAVFVGEIRLFEFQKNLTDAGVKAEFSGGVLICNDHVAVGKDVRGQIFLEGSVCPTYYTVRKLLYDQYAIV